MKFFKKKRDAISRQVTISHLLRHVELASKETDEALMMLMPHTDNNGKTFRKLISVKTHFDLLKMLVKALPE